MTWVLARWRLLDPRVKAGAVGLGFPLGLVLLGLAPLWLILIVAGLWSLVVVLGIVSASVEIVRERRAA